MSFQLHNGYGRFDYKVDIGLYTFVFVNVDPAAIN